MSYFLVSLGHGPAWDAARPRRRQAGWAEHARAMDALVDAGVIVLGGPVGDDPDSGDAVMLVRAPDAEAAARAFEADPWHRTVLAAPSVRPWALWLGDPGER